MTVGEAIIKLAKFDPELELFFEYNEEKVAPGELVFQREGGVLVTFWQKEPDDEDLDL
jgi:hypothetical protein